MTWYADSHATVAMTWYADAHAMVAMMWYADAEWMRAGPPQPTAVEEARRCGNTVRQQSVRTHWLSGKLPSLFIVIIIYQSVLPTAVAPYHTVGD